MSVKVNDNTAKFLNQSEKVLDSALSRMSKDMVLITKITIPYLEGDLQEEVKAVRISSLRHKVEVRKEYAAYQERGQRLDGSRKVRNYTTPGTGKGFLKKAGKKVESDAINYLRQAGQLVKI